jgi:hypothetical protein
MRNRYIFTILSLCSIVMTISFLHITGRVHGVVPGDGNRPEFTHAVGQFINPQPEDGSPYYESTDIQHPADEETPSGDTVQIKAKLDDCESRWPSLPMHWPVFAAMRHGEEPMSVHNVRHTAITLKMIPMPSRQRSSWTIAPGTTWKTYTHIGQRWLFADRDRCLFYITAGDEPLRMVVKSEAR